MTNKMSILSRIVMSPVTLKGAVSPQLYLYGIYVDDKFVETSETHLEFAND